jgi:microcystin-dependent protein
MNRDGIPLPSALTGVIQERLIRIDEALLFLILGALVELTDDWWLEQTGALTVEDAKAALNDMLWCFQEGCDVTPIGSVQMWAITTPPSKWLICNGQSLLRSSYAALFAILGTSYGAADGTHFYLPDYRDYSPMGVGSTLAIGGAAGTFQQAISISQMPTHNHAITDTGHVHAERLGTGNLAAFQGAGTGGFAISGGTSGTATRINTDSATTGISTNNAGSGGLLNMLHPVRGVHFIIYAGA